ncbi:MAG: recombinase family protein [bacterium]|nr:recombinase family protein [bacterium]
MVTKVDRFSRSIVDFLNTNQTLVDLGIEFYPVDQGIFGTKGPEGELMRNILLAFAQFEREMTRKRTTEGMRAKIARGEWRGGPTPFGYKSENGRLC